MNKDLVKSTAVVSGMTLISRIFGFIRDIVTAELFGAGAALDAFTVAFKIPNVIRQLFAEGAFSQAFVPVLAEHQKTASPEEMQRFVNAMAGTLGMMLVLTTITGILFAPLIIRIVAPGFEVGSTRFDWAVTILRITFPYLLLVSLAAFAGAILNTYNRFWVAALSPAFLNITMIAASIWLAPHLHVPVTALAGAVVMAGILQFWFQWHYLKPLRLISRPRINFRNTGVRKVLKLMVPAIFGVSVAQINLLLDTVFASFLVIGSVSWLYYSDRLMDVPLGIFGVALATVILPHLSRCHATRSDENFSLILDWALRCVLLIGVPAAIIFAILSGPLLSTLFQHGQFDGHAVIMASKSLTAFALGIVPFILIKILAVAFYAKQNMRTPVWIGVISVFFNILFNFLLIFSLAHAGIALATSLAAFFNMAFLYYYLRHYNIYRPAHGWKFFTLRLIFANIVLAVWLLIATNSIDQWLSHHWIWRATHLTLLLLPAFIFYVASLWLSGMRLHMLIAPMAKNIDYVFDKNTRARFEEVIDSV